MNSILYLLPALILSSFSAFASQGTVQTEPSGLKGILQRLFTKGFIKPAGSHPPLSLDTVRRTENVAIVRKTMEEMSMTLPYLCDELCNSFLPPKHSNLLRNYYVEQRRLSSASDEFDEFDARFYDRVYRLYMVNENATWGILGNSSSKEEVMCEAMYFYNLIDFERAITCLDDAPPTTLTCKVFSNFVTDMYFGEAKRPDFSYEGDVETRKWLDDMLMKYEGSKLFHTASLMRRFTRNIRGKVDNKLWNDYMRAMMTVHMSADLLRVNANELKDLYNYLADNNISNEFMFASDEWDPLLPDQTVQSGHAFLRTFKLDPSGETATMGIINSGNGIQFHDKDQFKLSELPDIISRIPNAESVFRYIPFVVYDAVPRKDWGPVYTEVDSMEKAYFGHKQKKHEFSRYNIWQFIDEQRAGTCSAMALWSGLYWFERESQQKLESFRLALYLEILKEAAKELYKLRTSLEEMDDQIFDMTEDGVEWEGLQLMIKEKSDLEDDYLRFFSVAFNSAIRSIRYLHFDPFKQGLDMTAIMQKYVIFYNSQRKKTYWQLIKPYIDDLYTSTFDLILQPDVPLSLLITPKTPIRERDCVDYVKYAIKSKDPFNFVKATISGIESKCHGKDFFESINDGASALILKVYHQDLTIRALSMEMQLLPGRRVSILAFIEKLITDRDFQLFPTYKVLPTERINFFENIYQVFELEDDEVQQFVSNCAAYEPLAILVLSTANELVESIKKTLVGDVKITEEHMLYIRLVHLVSAELQRMDPHPYARHLSELIRSTGTTAITNHINSFKPSQKWDMKDYKLLESAARESGMNKDFMTKYIEYFDYLNLGQEFALKHSSIPPTVNLLSMEYVCVGKVYSATRMDSPLDFVKAIVFGVEKGCQSELFYSSITFGIERLKLEEHHQSLILIALGESKDKLIAFQYIDKLITTFHFRLFPLDNALPDETIFCSALQSKVPLLKNDIEIHQFAINCYHQKRSPAHDLLAHIDRKELSETIAPRFLDHIFTELTAMNPHLYAYHLSYCINMGALIPKDFDRPTFRPFKDWNHYDYILIDYQIPHYYRIRFDKIFTFPTEYHIDTTNAHGEEEFKFMSFNPSVETLEAYAVMLFNRGKRDNIKDKTI